MVFEEHLALLEAGEKPPAATDPEVDGIVEAIDGVVAAAAYMVAATVGRPGGNYGHWIGRTQGQEQPGDRLRYSALCEKRHWIEVVALENLRDACELLEVGAVRGAVIRRKRTRRRAKPLGSKMTA